MQTNMEDLSPEWKEIEDKVYCKVDPFTMQAMVMKAERKGFPKIFLKRKRYENIVKTLNKHYASLGDMYFNYDEEEEEGLKAISDTEEAGEEVHSRLALGLLRLRCSWKKSTTHKLTIPKELKKCGDVNEEEDADGMVAKMSRNRWQVAVGMVMGMAKMASHNIQDDHEPFCVGDISFDLNFFKANKNIIVLSADSKFVLSQVPEKRTKEQIDDVIKNLYCIGIKSFNDYPKAVQQKLIRVARYEVVTPQRVIVRQGCPAENLYFLINGSVLIMKRIRNPRKNKDSEKSSILQKGATFGELEMVNRIQRSATAISHSNVQLLSIECGELHSVFTTRQSKTELPDHVKFLKKCKFTALWPIELLSDNLDFCAPYFFKCNSLMVEDIEKTDWIFVIRSGLCRVIRKLWKPIWNLPMRNELIKQDAALGTEDNLFRKRFALYYPLYSKTCRIFAGKAHLRKAFSQGKAAVAGRVNHTKRAGKKFPKSEKSRDPSLGNRNRVLTNEKADAKSQTKGEDKSVPERNTNVNGVGEKETLKNGEYQFKLEQEFLAIGTHDDKEIEKQDDLGSGEGDEYVYIQIDTLRANDVFGLDTLVFDKYYDKPHHPGLGLVSASDERGVEVVLLSKSYFVEHASEHVAWRVRKMAKSYPEARLLEQDIERHRMWTIYKKDVITEVLEKKFKMPQTGRWK